MRANLLIVVFAVNLFYLLTKESLQSQASIGSLEQSGSEGNKLTKQPAEYFNYSSHSFRLDQQLNHQVPPRFGRYLSNGDNEHDFNKSHTTTNSSNKEKKQGDLSSGKPEDTTQFLTTSYKNENDHLTGDTSANGQRLERSLDTIISPKEKSLGHKQPIILGIRCDQGVEVLDGALVIKANEPTEVTLFGHHLNANISIALTTEKQPEQADCTHSDRVRSIQFKNVSSNIAHVVIDAPAQTEMKTYYLCLRDSKELWYHQGSDAWLTLHVKEDFLPLYMKIIVIACLLMLSGLFSGLNLGLMALDKNELQVIISCGSDTEKRYARAIEPVRRRGNYLLCSILFSNVLVNSTIAVLLEELTSGIVAVMVSTIFIVMFGEILPQAFCSRHGLAVGAKTVSITYFCMVVTFPLSYPISFCLDWALGEEIGHAYDRERLMEFIRVTRDYNNLETDEVNIISGALKLKRIPLSQVMTRIDDVYMLDIDSCLDFETIQAIMERGYSRIPVHEANNKKNIIALLFAKDLALLDPDDRTPVQTMINFYKHPMMFLFEDTTLDLALNEFKTGRSHMAFVRRVIDDGDRDPVYEITGIVTLEDVIEEIMQMEINDETDTVTDNRRKRCRKEAQVRGDFSQFTHFGTGDLSSDSVTPQLCLAAYQYLSTTVEPFSPKYISDSVLKRLLSQKIYYKVRVDGNQKLKRLYTAGEQVDCFIMILEGRVQVTCGQESLVFNAGPFSSFGRTALLAADGKDDLSLSLSGAGSFIIPGRNLRKESNVTRQFLGSTNKLDQRDSPTAANNWRTSGGQLTISMKKLEQQQQQLPLLPIENSDSDQQNSGTNVITNTAVDTSGTGGIGATQVVPIFRGSRGLKHSESRVSLQSFENKSNICITSDYTVEVVANTSYLKITRSEYLAALKATIVERGTLLETPTNSLHQESC